MIPLINLYPWREERQRFHRWRFYLLFIAVILFSLLSQLTGVMYLDGQLEAKNREIGSLEQKRQLQKNKQQRADEIRIRQEVLIKQTAGLAQLRHDAMVATRTLNLLAAHVADKTYLNTVTLKGNAVVLKGFVNGDSLTADTLSLFRSSPNIADLSLRVMAHDKEVDHTQRKSFRLSFSLVFPLNTEVQKEVTPDE